MNELIKEYLAKYPSDIIDMYTVLRNLIFDSSPSPPGNDVGQTPYLFCW